MGGKLIMAGYAASNNGLSFRSVNSESDITTGEVYFNVDSPNDVTATELSAAFSGYAAAIKATKIIYLNAWLETSKSTVRNSISDLNLADGTSATMDSKLSSLQTKYNTLLSSYNTKLAVIKNG